MSTSPEHPTCQYAVSHTTVQLRYHQESELSSNVSMPPSPCLSAIKGCKPPRWYTLHPGAPVRPLTLFILSILKFNFSTTGSLSTRPFSSSRPGDLKPAAGCRTIRNYRGPPIGQSLHHLPPETARPDKPSAYARLFIPAARVIIYDQGERYPNYTNPN